MFINIYFGINNHTNIVLCWLFNYINIHAITFQLPKAYFCPDISFVRLSYEIKKKRSIN